MEETQTKKLNLRALKSTPIEESQEESKIPEAPIESTDTEGSEKKWEEKVIQEPNLNSQKQEEDVVKAEETPKDPSEEKETPPSPIKKLSLNMLKKESAPTQEKKQESIVQTKWEEVTTKSWEKTQVTRVNLKPQQDTESSEIQTEKLDDSESPVKEPLKIQWGAEENTTKNSENETQEDKKEEEKEEEKKITVVSPEENHDNTAVINAIIGEDEPLEKEVEKKEEAWEEAQEEEIHFQNYESRFKEQSTKVIERLRNFKYSPKTRKWFVLGLIILTISIVSWVMVFFPDHPINQYKASLLEAYIKPPRETTIPIPDTSNNDNNTQQVEENWENTGEENTDTNTQNEQENNDVSDIKENQENNQETDEPILTEEEIRINNKKKEALREHLLEKYYKKR